MSAKKTEMPMMDCPLHAEYPKVDAMVKDSGLAEFVDPNALEKVKTNCPPCNGTGKVIDYEAMKQDIADAVVECPEHQWDSDDRKHPSGCVCKGEGTLPRFPGLREKCPCLCNPEEYESLQAECLQCGWLDGQYVHAVNEDYPTWNCDHCGGKGYTADFGLEDLLKAVPASISMELVTLRGKDSLSWLCECECVGRGIVSHESPNSFHAAIGAVWLALQEMG